MSGIKRAKRSDAWFRRAEANLRTASLIRESEGLESKVKKLSEIQLGIELTVKCLIIDIIEGSDQIIPPEVLNVGHKILERFRLLIAQSFTESDFQAISSTIDSIFEIYKDPKAGEHNPVENILKPQLISEITRAFDSSLNFLLAHKGEFAESTKIPTSYLDAHLNFWASFLNSYRTANDILIKSQPHAFRELINLTSQMNLQVEYFKQHSFDILVWQVDSLHLLNGTLALSGLLSKQEGDELKRYDAFLGNAFLAMIKSRSIPQELKWLEKSIVGVLAFLSRAPTLTYINRFWESAKYPEVGSKVPELDAELIEHVGDAEKIANEFLRLVATLQDKA